MLRKNNIVVLPIQEKPKQTWPNFHLQKLVTDTVGDRQVCPANFMEAYSTGIRPLRGQESRHFISHQKLHVTVACPTISRRIKTTMGAAGIDTERLKAHSTRAAATGKAKAAGVPIRTIMGAVGWTSDAVFERALRQGHK